MVNFQLLSREQEVEIAKRIEAGEQEVEEEVLKSPVTLDFLIDLGERIEAGEADLRDIFEESDILTRLIQPSSKVVRALRAVRARYRGTYHRDRAKTTTQPLGESPGLPQERTTRKPSSRRSRAPAAHGRFLFGRVAGC
jgi:RNA polymerase primary sigma factor